MFKGEINAALSLLANENSAGVLSIHDALLNSLKAKHPDANAKFNLLLEDPREKINPVAYES